MYFLDSPATFMLMVVTVLVSGYALHSRPDLMETLAFRPRRVRDNNEYYRLGTAWLVHVGIGHLALNLFTLYFFGRALEAMLGTAAFLVIFFVSELAANGMTFWLRRDSPSYASVGASGAVSGVLFAFALYRPLDLIYVFAALPIPAWLFAILFVVLSIAAMKRPGGQGGIAHEAHLGGALGGILAAFAMNPSVFGIFFGRLGF
ncbi:MAG: rhomboid family intramembrane serine protease [Rhodothermales bacterium]|nr:rhomboid family intramembrane serine protease [Rhodothermales bacterium]MBO6779491.1 rhomboid family intramembrane serine protease [Rhodothermales bacterium]